MSYNDYIMDELVRQFGTQVKENMGRTRKRTKDDSIINGECEEVKDDVIALPQIKDEK